MPDFSECACACLQDDIMHIGKVSKSNDRLIYLMNFSILSLYLSGELTLVAIGPLTNIAMAIRMDPWFGKRLKKCYIMGGNYLGK